jgi:hypothetical protein
VSARDALDAIAARLDAIGAGEEISGSRLGALTDDLAAMHAALMAVLAEHQPSPGSTDGHGRNGYLGPVCLTCRNADGYPDPWPCDTNLTAEAALKPKGDGS